MRHTVLCESRSTHIIFFKVCSFGQMYNNNDDNINNEMNSLIKKKKKKNKKKKIKKKIYISNNDYLFVFFSYHGSFSMRILR